MEKKFKRVIGISFFIYLMFILVAGSCSQSNSLMISPRLDYKYAYTSQPNVVNLSMVAYVKNADLAFLSYQCRIGNNTTKFKHISGGVPKDNTISDAVSVRCPGLLIITMKAYRNIDDPKSSKSRQMIWTIDLKNILDKKAEIPDVNKA